MGTILITGGAGFIGSNAAVVFAEDGWDVVILDMNLPDIQGMDVLRRIKLVRPTLPVILISFHPAEHVATWANQSGAAAYVSKDRVTKELVHVINHVVDGGTDASPSVAENHPERLG